MVYHFYCTTIALGPRFLRARMYVDDVTYCYQSEFPFFNNSFSRKLFFYLFPFEKTHYLLEHRVLLPEYFEKKDAKSHDGVLSRN